MSRRSRAGGEPVKTRRHKAVMPKRRSAPESVGQETELARRTRERDEALEQFSATSEVLKVISGSAGELEPVFGAMLENATRICEATSGLLVRAENDAFRIVASWHQRADIEDMKHRTFRFGPSTPIGRAVRTRQIVHVPDLSEDRAYLEREPLAVWAVEQANVRTVLVVPMLKQEELVGVFGLEREKVRPFTDKQIALVQTFAAQAVIAIENARLLNELRESLERQTATADVLRVISSSPGDLKPVFNAMLENAVRLCEAEFGHLFLYDGEAFHTIVIGLTAFLTVVDLFATQAILPSLTRAYQVTPAAMGFAVNSSTMGMAVAGLVVSLFSQRINRRLGILISLSILSIPTALLAVAPDLTTFTVLRILQGLCMASAFTLTLAYLGEECSAVPTPAALLPPTSLGMLQAI